MSHDYISYFAKFIEKELGIIYSDSNHYQLQNRLDEIVRMLGLASVAELHTMAITALKPEVKQLILDVATNNETSFFRDPKMFKALASQILPQHLGGGKKLRIWSAACSYGQEPYTLAMLIHENFPSSVGHVEIIATDIATRVLERAKQGRYTQLEVQRGLPAPLMIKYFQKSDDSFWTISDKLRSMIQFRKLNLLDPFSSMGTFDLILCRNVLIYQNVDSKIAIIKKLVNNLNPQGHLIMGAGESMIGLSDAFETVRVEETIVHKIRSPLQNAA